MLANVKTIGRWGLFLLAVTLPASGCNRSGPATYAVSGTVNWNGAPLGDGSIVFMAADGKTVAAAGTIRDGRFAFRAQAGKKKVEIRAVREVGEVIPAMGVKARQSYIPARYNAQTILVAEVAPDGENQFKFDLSDPAKAEADGKGRLP
jgi:hypothetical protein